ncbi:KAP family P-loop NTPase fold protein [Methanobrevibacter smithii]|uniref:KAP family P-loop NTPase fold protein n=1 Tax=Methanobrevibacter smithii TaxID=2173 RepID=UPI0037DC52B4
MFIDDAPINDFKKDCLNIQKFAKNLTTNIENYFNDSERNESLTIGITGEWGSGKTSLLNLIDNLLNKENNKKDIEIIRFNPWIYSSHNQLMEQFFDEIVSSFSNIEDNTLKNNLKKYLFKLNKHDLAKSIATTGISMINSDMGKFTEQILKLDSEETNLFHIKEEINKQLSLRKVICVIDDIDRLTHGEINEMFKLIKNVADFNNMVYLIAFDKQIVSKALNQNYGNGEKYLEKIINIPLNIPLITKEEIKEILIKNLKKISEKYDLIIDHRLNTFIDFEGYGIIYFFKNMRDIKRFINIIEFNIELIKEEINFTDFIVITAIQLFKPDTYEKIKYEKYLLVDYIYSISDYSNHPEFIALEKEEFKQIVNDDKNTEFILKELFSKMSFIDKPNHQFQNFSQYDKNLMICHPNNFKSYFKLNNIVKKITEHEINIIIELINSENKKSTKKQFKILLKEDNINLFFEKLTNRISKIKKHEFLLNMLFEMDEISRDSILSYGHVKELCLELLRQINNGERFNILKKEYQKSNNIIFLYEFINKIEKNNYIPYKYDDEKLLSETEINKLKNMIKTKYKEELIKNELQYYNLNLLLTIGDKLGLKNENEKIIKNLIETNEGLIILLKSFLSETKKSAFLESDMKELNEYIELNTLKNRINENLDELKEEQIVINFLEGFELIAS